MLALAASAEECRALALPQLPDFPPADPAGIAAAAIDKILLLKIA
jgi:hypothetical protein